jgi:hypothetical protein
MRRTLFVILLLIISTSACLAVKRLGYEINGPATVTAGKTFTINIKPVHNIYKLKQKDVRLDLPGDFTIASPTPEYSVDGSLTYIIKAGTGKGVARILIYITSKERGTQIYIQKITVLPRLKYH